MNNIKPQDMQVFEILNEISDLQEDNLKVQLLKTKYYDHTPLHRILKMNFCKTIVPILPEGTPPYNRNENADGPNQSSLWQFIRVFPIIVKSQQSLKMKPLQIENLFIEMLEAVDSKEADVICLAKDKNLETQYQVSCDIVTKAFPMLKIEDTGKVVEEPSDEDKALNMLERAERLKAQAKDFNAQAKDLIKKAKELSS
jgi:hypothetical protein